MLRAIFLILLGSSLLFGFSDSDLDGVDDSLDRCPNTPISDIVDKNGCSVKSVIIDQGVDLIFGLSFSQLNYRANRRESTETKIVQIDYYREDFTLEFQTSYYSSGNSRRGGDSGWNDSSIFVSYRWRLLPDFTVETGVGLILPTYDTGYNNNKTDYGFDINLNYRIDRLNFFTGYEYTIVNDDDVVANEVLIYKNTNSLNFGVGYDLSKDLSVSLSYNQSDSIYQDVEMRKNISLYGSLNLNKNLFVAVDYESGLTDSTSGTYLEFRVGVSF